MKSTQHRVGHSQHTSAISSHTRLSCLSDRFVVGAVVVCLSLSMLSGCSSTRVSLYDPDAINKTKTWHVDFTYEAGRFEEVLGKEGENEQKIVKEGHPPTALQLRDDVFFRLRDKFGVQTIKDAKVADGLIRIHPVYFGGGGFRSADVVLLGKSEEILARIRVQNGDRNATVRDNQSFANFCADAIGSVIVGKRRKP